MDISIFFTKFGAFKTKNAIQKILSKNLEVKEFLENLYDDSLSIQETLYRYKNGIDIRPVCKYCGRPAKFVSYLGFLDYCDSKDCSKKHKVESIKNTKLERYGNQNFNNFEKISLTKLERYNDSTYNNRDKCRQTKLEQWGDEHYTNVEQMKKTKYDKYGCYFVNPDKAKETKKERYGDENYNNYEQIKETCKNKFGVETPLQNSDIRQKGVVTKLEKYGCYFVNPDKAKETKKERYGDETYNNRNQAEITTFLKYGSTNYFSSEECIKKSHTKEALEKINNTKKKNHTFNVSSVEKQVFVDLIEIFGENDIKTQYSSNDYPFKCDFYVKSLDMYIECNFHWTHGGHRFNEKDLNDIEQLKLWESKNTKYYNNAIVTWTKRDVQKYNIAENNKLNYVTLYNQQQYCEFLNNLKDGQKIQ